MQPVRKLAIPAVLAVVVLGSAALVVPSCGDDDGGPVADGQPEDALRDGGSVADGQPGDAPDDGMTPDVPLG